MVRSYVYVVLPCFEFEYSPGPQNSHNKSSKDLYRRKKRISSNCYIPGLSNNPALCTTSLPDMSPRSNEKKKQQLVKGQFHKNEWTRALNLRPRHVHTGACNRLLVHSDTGQQISRFERCQLTITWVSNIRKRRYKPRVHVSVNPLAWIWPPSCAPPPSCIRPYAPTSNIASHDSHDYQLVGLLFFPILGLHRHAIKKIIRKPSFE